MTRVVCSSLGFVFVALVGCQGQAESSRVSLPDNGRSMAQSGHANDGAESEEVPGLRPETGAAPGHVQLTGTTVPHRESAVAAQGTGSMKEVLVEAGDMVEGGQVLARLDRQDARLRTRQAKTALKAAGVQRAAAEREQRRIAELGTAVPAARSDRAGTALASAQVAVEAAEVALAMARKAEKDATIRAPFSGLVVKVLATEGEWVSTMRPSPVVMLAEVSPIDLRVEAPEHLLSKIVVGDSVSVRFGALDLTVDAKITRVIPTVHSATRSFTVIAEVPNPDQTILPGVFAEVSLNSAPSPAAPTEGAAAVEQTVVGRSEKTLAGESESPAEQP